MSFGFSLGDFLAIGRLIYDISTALRGSRTEYADLVCELESLARALHHVEQLTRNSKDETLAIEIERIRCAALMCRLPLEEFYGKMVKFEGSLGRPAGSRKSCGMMLKDAARKAQWAFGLGAKDEVGRLRSYLGVHVGVVNMLLMQYGFEKVDLGLEERKGDYLVLKDRMDKSVREVEGVRGSVQAQALVVTESHSMIRTLLDMVGGEIAAPLRAMTRVVTKLCASTQQIYNIALEIRASTCSIDTRFLYFQSPIKVEDVLGRVFPFPAEFSVAALDAEIMDRFKIGPGKSEVAAGHYEIFNAKNTNELIGLTSDSILRPGMSILMSIILERKTKEDDKCPVTHCQSTNVFATLGGRLCPDCDTWFKNSGKKRKRGYDAPSLPDDSENRKKLKPSIHEPQSRDSATTTHMDIFKRISFVQENQARKHRSKRSVPALEYEKTFFTPSPDSLDNYSKIDDIAKRRRIQNRIAQRNYREKMKRRLADSEEDIHFHIAEGAANIEVNVP